MKELKFTPETLEKHMKVANRCSEHTFLGKYIQRNRKRIVTTRDEAKGVAGDLFRIEGVENLYVLNDVKEYSSMFEYVRYFCATEYWKEGYDTPDELLNTVVSFYPKSSKFYVHVLDECYLNDENKQ